MAGFKAHGDTLGPRLEMIRPLGPSGLARAFGSAAAPAPAVRAASAKKPKGAGGRRRGIEGEPWVEAGVTRRTWERRRRKAARAYQRDDSVI